MTKIQIAQLLEWTGQIPAPKHSQAVKVSRPLPRVLRVTK